MCHQLHETPRIYSSLYLKKNIVSTLEFAHMIWLLMLALVDLSHEECMKETPDANLSCVLYSVTSMNCTWNAGIKPPEEYFLFLNFNKKEEECPHYIKNEHGKRVCHLPYVSVNTEEATVTVKKLVNQSLIPVDTKENLNLIEYEILGPPQNITVNCNERTSECNVTWIHPPNRRNLTRENCFLYEIKDKTGNTVTDIEENYTTYPADKKHTLQIRAYGRNCPITEKCGEWSEPIEIGSDPNTFPTIYLILVVLGTVLTILALFFLCKRFPIWQKLTDPIPQPNLILDPDENMGRAWLDLTQTEEKITLVEEMTNSCKMQEGFSSTSQMG